MEYSVKEKTIEAVLTSSTLETNIDGGKLDVVIGEAAKMDAVQAINFIRSGQAEIDAAVTSGISQFDINSLSKTNEFNNNATNKTNAFNSNAVSQTADFNDNYTAKKALIEADVQLAKNWANKTDGTVDGSEYSAKYYAEQAASELSGLAGRVSTIEGKIPSDASSSNQLADKNYVATNYVPQIRTINGKALSSNISLSAADVGALPDSTVIPAAQVNSDWNAVSGVAEILNKPTIPTVNDSTITLTQGGVTKGSFTLNQASGATIDFDAGGDINNKADKDLSNVTAGSFENVVAQAQASGKETVTGWPFPSTTYDDLTLGASGTEYTATASGYYTLYKVSSAANQFIQMINIDNTNDKTPVTDMVIRAHGNGDYVGCFIPCKKGNKVIINYTLGGATQYFRFCYADGEI